MHHRKTWFKPVSAQTHHICKPVLKGLFSLHPISCMFSLHPTSCMCSLHPTSCMCSLNPTSCLFSLHPTSCMCSLNPTSCMLRVTSSESIPTCVTAWRKSWFVTKFHTETIREAVLLLGSNLNIFFCTFGINNLFLFRLSNAFFKHSNLKVHLSAHSGLL